MCVRDLLLKLHAWLHLCVSSKKIFSPLLPDIPVPDTEIEKEEDESSSQAQTPAEESGVKVLLCWIRLCKLSPLLFSSSIMYFCLTTSPPCVQVPKRIEVHSIHTYVALYKFLPQEQNDLELQWVKAKQTAYMQAFFITMRVHVQECLCGIVLLCVCECICFVWVFVPPCVLSQLLFLEDENVPTICRGRCQGALKDD